ncbi:MAG: hypothetical protein HY673_14270, partial [Chloroflexi bacterium]|nr:hypothetical protein [Chloroflexota bacterium]
MVLFLLAKELVLPREMPQLKRSIPCWEKISTLTGGMSKSALGGEPIGIKGSFPSALEHGNLYGNAGIFAERYETYEDMLEDKRKDFADLPFMIRPYEEMLLTLEFQLFFEKESPHRYFIVKGTKNEFESIFDRLMP